jgi:ABC-type dipeptide/oligopeptide/nickel transport system permease subunit
MQRSDYLLRKLLIALLTLVVVIIFNFFLFRILPGDPARALVAKGRMNAATLERIQQQFGLDKPVWLDVDKLAHADLRGALDSQFTAYVGNLLKGNLGVSFANRLEVTDILKDKVWKTVVLLLTGEVVAIILGSTLGVIASWRRGSRIDLGILVWGLFTWSIPTFFFGIVLVILARGRLPTGMMVTVGLKPEDGLKYWSDVARHLILPTIALGVGFASSYMMVMRSSMVEVLSEDYILTAKAKGLSNFRVLRDHALKNAMLPMVTLLALSLAYTVGGAIQIETVFSWPGLGRLIFDSVGKQDYPVLQGAFLLIAVSVIVANFLADVFYTILDPRVKMDTAPAGQHANLAGTLLSLPRFLLAAVTAVLRLPVCLWNVAKNPPHALVRLAGVLGGVLAAAWHALGSLGRGVEIALVTFKRRPMAMVGLIMLLAIVLVAVLAPMLAPYSPEELAATKVTAEDILAPPNAAHVLGTDDAGKDVLSQLIYGARISLIVGFSASFMSLIIGTAVGMSSGYFGGKVDTLLMRITDFLMVIPTLPLMLVIISFWGRGLDKIIMVIGLLYWTYMARLVRSQVISIKERQYVLRARALGVSDLGIIVRHIFPQVLPLIIAQGVLDTSNAIIAESSLAFLGLGDPTRVSWGMMLNFAFARGISQQAWWFLLPPGFAIVWVSLSLVLIGTALEEIFNPRLKTHHLFDARKMVARVVGLKPKEGAPVPGTEAAAGIETGEVAG